MYERNHSPSYNQTNHSSKNERTYSPQGHEIEERQACLPKGHIKINFIVLNLVSI